MKAVIINCTLKKSPTKSNTQLLAEILAAELKKYDVEVEHIRAVDHNILPGVTSNEGKGDDWPPIRQKILDSEILILASPTWVGLHSSVAQRVIERINGMFGEKDESGRQITYNHVAGFVATGGSDGAKHVINLMAGALIEDGFTVPGQSWAYFNNGSPKGPALLEADDSRLKNSKDMAANAASNLVAVAGALKKNPIPKQPK